MTLVKMGPEAAAYTPCGVVEPRVDPQRIAGYFDRLWPICRSLAGPGYRESLDIVGELMPTERLRFATGQQVHDWIVPNEWRVHDAYFVDPTGTRHAEFKCHNLHLVSYSVPFRGRLSLADLRRHLHSIPEQPDAIPYRTSCYHENWGFCISERELQALPDGEYDVVVDTELYAGHVEAGEAILPGEEHDEILFSTYLCHPSLANNELSGPLVMAFLYEWLARLPRRRLTYRFVIVPETIGAICYLSERGTHLRRRVQAGFQLTCIGDRGQFTYKLSREGNTLADRVARAVLLESGPHEVLPFDPFKGSDERQYCSPGYNLPLGSLMRTRYLQYAEYHTSLDNRDFISFDALSDSVAMCARIVASLEDNVCWENTIKYGEPQLGRRGLYTTVGGLTSTTAEDLAMMWVLNLADGSHDVVAMAERSCQPLTLIRAAAARLAAAGLLRRVVNE